MKLGMLYHANGFSEQAIESYRRALKLSSAAAHAKLHYLHGMAAEMQSDTEEAAAAFSETLRIMPKYVPALLRLADLRYKSGDSAAALSAFRTALSIDADCPEALLAVSREEIRKGDWASALAKLDRLEKTHPEYGSGRSLKAQLLEQRGDLGEADAIRRQGRTRKDPPMADPFMDEVMGYCVDVQRLSILFEDALNAGRLGQAMASLDRIQELEPDNWTPYRLRGFALAHNGQAEAAVGEYRKAIGLGGDAATVYPGLVSALMKLERFTEAERAASEGLAAAPATGSLLVLLAEMKLKQHQRGEAESLLIRALDIDDRDLTAFHALARLQWHDGRKAEAMTHFETVTRLDPADLPARVLVGQHYLERGEPEKAIEPLSQAQALSPGDADVQHLLALAWLRHGNQQAREQKFDEALASYDAAIGVQPRHVEAHANKARLLTHLRRPEADAAAEAARKLQFSP